MKCSLLIVFAKNTAYIIPAQVNLIYGVRTNFYKRDPYLKISEALLLQTELYILQTPPVTRTATW